MNDNGKPGLVTCDVVADAIHNVVVTPSVSRLGGGLFQAVRRLHQEMAALGAEVTVHAGRDRFSDPDIAVWTPLAIQCHRNSWAGPFLGYYPPPASLVSAGGTGRTVLHVHGLWQAKSLAAHRAARKYGLPCVVSPHGMLDPWALHNSRWKKQWAGWLFENRNLREAACIHALCDSEADAIRAYGLKNPIAIIPNGVDGPEQQRSQESGVRSQNKGKRQLLFLGRIHPKKGLKELIEAWGVIQRAEVSGQGTGWELAIAGWDDGAYLEGLKRQVAESGLGDSIHFIGPTYGAQKDELLKSAEAFVLPSFSEGLPMAVLEAWAYGLPVVMTPACNLPDGARCEAAIMTEPQPVELVAALRNLLAMNDLERQAMGSNGRRLVLERYAWPGIARQMRDVYKWLLGRRQRPDCVRIN